MNESTFDAVRNDVMNLLKDNHDGHGMDHVDRVVDLAGKFYLDYPEANYDVVVMSSLLHDVDDYKIFGEDCADNLTNARKIMSAHGVDELTQFQVVEVIKNMGFSNYLSGIYPTTIEGKIVSDADLCESIGAVGVLRAILYALDHKKADSNFSLNGVGSVIFNNNLLPIAGIDIRQYKDPNREDNVINHCFEKLLLVKDLVQTEPGKKEANIKTDIMMSLLVNFFTEVNASDEWFMLLGHF